MLLVTRFGDDCKVEAADLATAAKLREFCETSGIALYDPARAVAHYAGPLRAKPGDHHGSAGVNEVVARGLADFLVASGLVAGET